MRLIKACWAAPTLHKGLKGPSAHPLRRLRLRQMRSESSQLSEQEGSALLILLPRRRHFAIHHSLLSCPITAYRAARPVILSHGRLQAHQPGHEDPPVKYRTDLLLISDCYTQRSREHGSFVICCRWFVPGIMLLSCCLFRMTLETSNKSMGLHTESQPAAARM